MAKYTINNVQMELDGESKTILVTADIQRDAIILQTLAVSLPVTKSSEDLAEQVSAIARRIVRTEQIKRQGITKAVAALEGLVL